MAYFDDGVFRLRVFGKETRTPEEIKKSDINLNDLLGLDNHTMAVMNFPDPYITCCFLTNDLLFVNLYYNPTGMHYHFFYNIEMNNLEG